MAKSLDSQLMSADKERVSLWRRFDWRPALAIDLGSSEIRIFKTARLGSENSNEELLIEPACVALKASDNKSQVLAIGADALEMRGRLGSEVKVVFPIVAGRVIDRRLAKVLLRRLMREALQLRQFLPFVLSPVVTVTVRAGTSDFSRGELSRLFYELGASEVYLIAEPLAAAIGVGVPVAEAAGTLLMQLGAASVEAAAISLGSITAFETSLWKSAVSSWDLDELLRAFLLREEHLSLSATELEQLKRQLSLDPDSKKTLYILGRDLATQKAKKIKLNNADFLTLLENVATSYLHLIEQLLQKVPQELLTDIMDRGLLLSGNLARLGDLDQYLAKKLKLPVALVDDPDLAAAKGALAILENLDQFKEGLGHG